MEGGEEDGNPDDAQRELRSNKRFARLLRQLETQSNSELGHSAPPLRSPPSSARGASLTQSATVPMSSNEIENQDEEIEKGSTRPVRAGTEQLYAALGGGWHELQNKTNQSAVQNALSKPKPSPSTSPYKSTSPARSPRPTEQAQKASTPTTSPTHSNPTPKKGNEDPTPVNPKEKKIQEWTINDVCQWLRGINFVEYEESFRKNNVDGNALQHLEKVDLVDLGVNSVGHRVAIWKEIQAIQMAQGIPTNPSLQLEDAEPSTTERKNSVFTKPTTTPTTTTATTTTTTTTTASTTPTSKVEMESDDEESFNLSDGEGELIFSEDNEAVIVACNLHKSVAVDPSSQETIDMLLRLYDEPYTKIERFMAKQPLGSPQKTNNINNTRPSTTPSRRTDGAAGGGVAKPQNSNKTKPDIRRSQPLPLKAMEQDKEANPNIRLISAAKKFHLDKDSVKSEEDMRNLIALLTPRDNDASTPTSEKKSKSKEEKEGGGSAKKAKKMNRTKSDRGFGSKKQKNKEKRPSVSKTEFKKEK